MSAVGADFVYEQRIVTFVDVLGWSAALLAAGAEGGREFGISASLLQEMEGLAESSRAFAASGPADSPMFGLAQNLEATQFSDCLVFSVIDQPGAMWFVEQWLSLLYSTVSQRGFLLRGGVAKGLVSHRSRMIFGPALICAYKIEQSANYPRVVISPDVELEAQTNAWRTDADGERFFDYLRSLHAIPNHYKALIARGLLNGDLHIREKYEWAREYYDSTFGPAFDAEHGATILDLPDRIVVLMKGEWPS